jgi:hypothetical protein
MLAKPRLKLVKMSSIKIHDQENKQSIFLFTTPSRSERDQRGRKFSKERKKS